MTNIDHQQATDVVLTETADWESDSLAGLIETLISYIPEDRLVELIQSNGWTMPNT